MVRPARRGCGPGAWRGKGRRRRGARAGPGCSRGCRSALLFRFSTTALVAARVRSSQQPVRLVLVAGDLQRLGEVGLVLAGLQVPADAADSAPQDEQADHDAEGGGAGDQAGSPGRAPGRATVVGLPVVELAPEQLVEVGADGLVRGGQPARRCRPAGQGERAEPVPDRGPLPDEQGHVGAFGGRVGGVQPFQREQPRVDRGEQAGVEVTEEPGPFGPIGGQDGRLPPAYAASMSLASSPVTTAVVSSSSAIALPWLAAERVPAMPTAATAAATSASAAHRSTSELAAARARVRIQLMVMDNLLMQIMCPIRYLCRIEGKSQRRYSHSIVAGGLLVMSSTTRLTSGTSLVIRVEIRASTSSGSRAQSAVIASSLVTGRSTTGWP